jgi:hypothetical protein
MKTTRVFNTGDIATALVFFKFTFYESWVSLPGVTTSPSIKPMDQESNARRVEQGLAARSPRVMATVH